ncbi:MAG: ATP-binding protein [Rhodothermaceae bacterium]
MKLITNISLKNKLIMIIFGVSIFGMLILFVMNLYRQINEFREDLVLETKLKAQLIGEYSIPTLDFDDPRAAFEILTKLDVIPHVISGYTFTSEGKLFASYDKENPENVYIPVPSNEQKVVFENDVLLVNQPIFYNDKKYGTVILIASTDVLKDELAGYFMYSIILFIIISFVTYILAIKLQRYISHPILNLADTAKDISLKNNYSVRVKKSSDDEIGVLYDEFNDMLDRLNTKEKERDIVEEQLKLNEFRLKKAQEISRVGSWEWLPEEKKLIWSNEMYRIFGVSEKEETLDQIVLQAILPDDLLMLRSFRDSLKQDDRPEFIEYRIIRNDGALRFIRAGGDFIFENRDIESKIGVVQDISEQKQAEIEILYRKQRFENIFNAAPVCIWEEDNSEVLKTIRSVVGEELNLLKYLETHPKFAYDALEKANIIDVNDAAIKMFGAGTKEYLLKNFSRIYIPESWEAIKKILNSYYEGVEHFQTEIPFKTFDGRRIDAIIKLSTFESNKLKNRVLVSITDITTIKKLDKEKETLLKEITQKNAELEQIVYVSSHDLRSPLVNIQGFSTELELSLKEIRALMENLEGDGYKEEINTIMDEDILSSLGFIGSSAMKMDSLLKGLLRLSRLGRTAITIEDIDMNQMFTKITDTMQFQIQKKDIKIEVADLPACKGDQVQVNQLFTNLIDNAVKYNDDTKESYIKIYPIPNNENSVYCVEDNGIGIDPNHKEKIFEIFHRLNPDSPIIGEGLGLSIVRRIVQKLNGNIWLESELNSGCKFYVSLPRA